MNLGQVVLVVFFQFVVYAIFGILFKKYVEIRFVAIPDFWMKTFEVSVIFRFE